MDRSNFIGTCGKACLGLIVGGSMLESCALTSYIPINETNGEFRIALSHFQKEGSSELRRYILIRPDSLDYPVVIYRNDKEDYSAMLLRCTHQGTELNVYGDLISCPAHGSEFNKVGDVVSGPAARNLSKFNYQIENDHLILLPL